jgi:DNA polymerase-3 subunit delta'
MARAPAALDIEAAPEADRLEGFPHPRETAMLLGHAAAEQALLQSFAAQRMHHAWLLAGREGIGKATLAYAFARFLLAQAHERDALSSSLSIAADTAAARQVRVLSHPGLLVIRRPWDQRARRHAAFIPVDEVRRLRSFLGHTAEEGAWRVVIVDRVDELNPNAANALLKSLEEPPTRTVFLLVTSAPGRLLPTIRSRCRVLELSPLSAPDLRQAAAAALALAEPARAEAAISDQLVALADGSVRRLLVLSGSNGLELHERIARILSALPSVDWPAAHVLADELASPASEQRFEIFFDLLLGTLARAVRAGANGGAEPDNTAQRLFTNERLPRWAELWQGIVTDKADVLALNLDRRAFVLGTLARLADAARA